MSTELIIALCALGTALAGIAVAIFKFGALAKEVEAIDQLRTEIGKQSDKIDELTRMIWELRGAMRSSPSRPPLEDS